MRAPDYRQQASVTLVALCFTTVLAIVLSSYLMLCYNSYRLSTRLLHEDKARQLALVGLEESLWALNQANWTSSGPGSASAWTISGSSQTVTLTYGSVGQGASGQLALTVANWASTGPATWPTITSAATITLGDGRIVTKTLQATTTTAPLFGNALASANSYVSFVSGGLVDSWNSDPDNNPATPVVAYSFTAGAPGNYAAVVAGNDNGTNCVIFNQALINGYVASFGQPASYSASSTLPGRLKGPGTPAAVNVDPERLGTSAFIPAFPVFAVNRPSTAGTNFGGLLNNILDLVAILLGGSPSYNVYEVTGDLTINGVPLLSPNMTIDHPMQLIVDGNFTIGGSGQITVTPTGSLQMFVAGDGAIGGNGILNQTNDPSKVSIFFTDSSTSNSVRWTTSADFYGVIYSVNKPIDIRQNATFYGALLSGQYVRFSTSATAPVFHYDTALRHVRFKDIATPFMINQLIEP